MNYSELRPLGVGRPVNDMRAVLGDKEILTGMMVFWLEDGCLLGGEVTGMHGDKLSVHVREANATATVWLPLWKQHDGAIVRRAMSKGCDPYVMMIDVSEVLVLGELTSTNRLPAALREMLEHRNLL